MEKKSKRKKRKRLFFLPAAEKMELAEHQRRALAELRAVEATPALVGETTVTSRIGWFADPPGAGKTRVVIALA